MRSTSLDHALLELRRLSRSVQQPGGLPTLDQVDALEQTVGARFHPDLRRYLLEASDVRWIGTKEPVTAVPSVVEGAVDFTYLPSVVESARQWGVPADLIPICEDNSDFYCMNERGEVVFWSHDGWTDEKWPDLATWIEAVWIGGN